MEQTISRRDASARVAGTPTLSARSITRAVICSDPLMTSETEQWSNLRWMRDLLSRPIAEATGLPVSSLSSGEETRDAFSRRRAFEMSGIEVDAEAVQFGFDDAKLGDETLAYLQQSGLDATTLLVGYELSDQTKRILDRLGVLYVDMWLHPVRFYEDILFAFQSNDPEVDAALAPFHLSDGQIRLYADRLKVQAYKGWKRKEAIIPPGSAAFFGQTLTDKSISRDGRMLTLLDFLDEFDALGARCQARGGRVLYQRHPFVRRGDEQVMEAVNDRAWAMRSSEPTYNVLASPAIEEVMTISSSVAQEARYFDKQATILYRPLIRFDEPARPDQFHTIFQDFVSPHFWAAILAPVMQVREVSPTLYVDPKDKLRDMLGFYWSWRQIDKTEAMRAELMDVNAKLAARNTGGRRDAAEVAPPEPDFSGFANTERAMADLRKRIDKAPIVSFDVFETLLERAIEKPEDLFFFMGRGIHEKFRGAIPNFIEARKSARGWAQAEAKGEEVSLAARYRAIAARFDLTEADANWLLDHELDWERRLMRARVIGKRAFEHARKQGKRVILISDTYFDRAFLEEMLKKCGYEGWDALYASSDHGMLKRTGRLFDKVIAAEGGDPDRILHIGDNPDIDVERAREKGMRAFHLRATPTIARRISPLPRAFDKIDDVRAASAVKALVARRVAGAPRKGTPGFSQGSAYTLGYAVLGPMFFGFANWLRRKAIEDGVEDLFFLSRDGDIAKRCYDAIAGQDAKAPQSHYLLASRRALRVATLRDAEDLADKARTNFSPCLLDELMRNRFGTPLSDLPMEARRRYGYEDARPTLDYGLDKDRLAAFVSDPEVAPVLLATAKTEADHLRAWYAAQGITPERAKKAAIVDIGHLGTLQKAMREFLETPELRGYYFVTFDQVVANVPDADLACAGWYHDRLKSKGSEYLRHLEMYETVFLNDEGSFVRIVEEDGALRPLRIDNALEGPRRDFARKCHDGIADFSKNMAAGFGEAILPMRLPPGQAGAAWRQMLAQPFPPDARLFRGVGFENLYSGRGVKYLIPPADQPRAPALWKEGRRRLEELEKTAQDGEGGRPGKGPGKAAAPGRRGGGKPSLIRRARRLIDRALS